MNSIVRTLSLLVGIAGFAILGAISVKAQNFAANDDNSLNILTAFRQAKGPNPLVSPVRLYGNCDSIALIKTAMATYGADGVLSSPTAIPESYDQLTYSVTLRNGHSIIITQAQLKTAIIDLKHNSGFVLPDSPQKGDPAILFKANFLYAVMAVEMLNHRDMPVFQYLDKKHHHPVKTYEDALDRMGAGVNVVADTRVATDKSNQIGLLLGLELDDVTGTSLNPSTPYIYAMRRHVVFAYGDEGDDFALRHPFATILEGHSTMFTRNLGENKSPKKYAIRREAAKE